MKRPDNYGLEEPPAGYEQVRLDSTTLLLLPCAAAVDLKAELRRREDEREECRQEALRQQQLERTLAANAEKQAQAASASRPRKRFAARPKPGWYRVLPRIGDLAKELDGGGVLAGHSEKEFTERLQKVRETLLGLGPDRRFAVPREWRHALARLERESSHFKEPIDLVRNSLALAEATGKPVRIPPMLLLGGPGLGKTYFSHRLATLLGVAHGAVAFDQPSYGGQLRGTDSAWANSQAGLLFNLIALGDCANPVIVLDELDKATGGSTRHDVDPLAQLHGALEPESARRIVDISVHIEFDASMVTYIGTANSTRRLELPVLSRFEVFLIEPPTPADSVQMARSIAERALSRLGLAESIRVERRAVCLLAHLSPRQMTRAVEKALGAVVLEGRDRVLEADVWAVLTRGNQGPRLH